VKQVLQWTVLAGAILVMGQTTALAEDAVSVLMKQPLADMAGEGGYSADRGLCAECRIRPACPSRFGVRLCIGGNGGYSSGR
jgi:hypothetical protein